MKMEITSVSTKGQIVIPAHMRHQLGLESGSKLAIFTDGTRILLRPLRPPHPAQFRRLIRESDRAYRKAQKGGKA